jgi:ribosomal protein L44E
MDALLLLVPLARAHCHKGQGDFHMSASGQAAPPQAGGGRAVRLYRHPDVSKRLLEGEHPDGPFSTNILWDRAIEAGRCFGAVHQGLWFDVGAPPNIAKRRPKSRLELGSSGRARRLGSAGAFLRPPFRYTIPPHRAFADALAAGLIARYGRTRPASRRARPGPQQPRRAGDHRRVRAALRRRPAAAAAGAGRRSGARRADRRRARAARGGGSRSRPRSIRRAAVAARRLVQRTCREIDAAEALRLAQDLARTLDQLLVEEVEPRGCASFAADLPELSLHWQEVARAARAHPRPMAGAAAPSGAGSTSPSAATGCSTRAVAKRWRERRRAASSRRRHHHAAPAVARLLRVVSRLPQGWSSCPALDLRMPEAEWDALGPHEPDPGPAAAALRSRRTRNST